MKGKDFTMLEYFIVLISISIMTVLFVLWVIYYTDKYATNNSPIRYTKKEFDYFIAAFSAHYLDTRYIGTTRIKRIMLNKCVEITIWDDTEIRVENYMHTKRYFHKSYFPKNFFTYIYAKCKIKQLIKQLNETTTNNSSLMEVANRIIFNDKVM